MPASVDATEALLRGQRYLADRTLSVVTFLALKLGRPLFLEGEAGVGKTEVARALAAGLGRDLIRLQCYEGLDASSALYEWNHLRQLLELRVAEVTTSADRSRSALTSAVFSPEFLIKRPLLQALEPNAKGPPVLLIDEIDRADEPFEAFLL
ncbi:MAG TPA: MoxR family ATPase, partial [Steroidobacteraceae bacterium]|nr:MoxR family ATPase [Steroidobacteraceae bacterium]